MKKIAEELRKGDVEGLFIVNSHESEKATRLEQQGWEALKDNPAFEVAWKRRDTVFRTELPNTVPLIPDVKVSAGPFEWMVKRKSESVPRKEEFKRIRQLEPDTVEKLEKISNNLAASSERTVRISDAFFRKLHKHAQIRNRVKLVIRAANEIQFHVDFQRI
ncbi:hypothetical protein PsorP6_010911 [Peronosclerospora sorghi]|uniref:Uncharacterized protein n=1 Tax=Peronosclerospora sorghi TaxID=230839 RepID=A0ACC0VTC3_9STRA|nr:hypothetical protein PsorP6_010911 [Peronosclerospora sorghi]